MNSWLEKKQKNKKKKNKKQQQQKQKQTAPLNNNNNNKWLRWGPILRPLACEAGIKPLRHCDENWLGAFEIRNCL